MAEYLIQESTLRSIADAIKAKTGSTEPIAVKDMANQISEITGGGGAVEGAYTVTFMSEDGSTVLYTKQVMEHDDCADPASLELIDMPTKESTLQYDYEYLGWAYSINGSVSASVLNNITSDRVVYAVFKANIRYYVINYYDGSTIIKTETLAYGAMPSYEPVKAGYALTGWSPELTTVTGDADYVAQWMLNIEGAVDFGECGTGVSWALMEDNTLRIIGEGAMTNYRQAAPSERPWHQYASVITALEVGEGITNLGDATCYAFNNLASVSLPSTLTRIGGHAFGSCTLVTSIDIPDSVRTIGSSAFSTCKALTSITIPTGVTEIADFAFMGCSVLVTVNLPNTIKKIGNSAFMSAKAIKTLTLPSSLEELGNNVFQYCTFTSLTIPAATKAIGTGRFDYSSISSVTFENTDGWYVTKTKGASSGSSLSSSTLANATTAANWLKTTYTEYYWYRK